MTDETTNPGPDAIEVEHLVKRFGELVAVNDISFNVHNREIFGLLGPNGAGKTTLIRMMTTLTPPTSGTARIAGHDIVKDADGVRHALGVIPQAFTSDPELTAEENMLIHAKLYGVPKATRRALVKQLLESVDLAKFSGALIRTFSGGMRRRLEIARGLVHSPKILFLDEPTAGVDVELRRDMWTLVRHMRERGVTIILTTHYIEEAEEMADRIGVINKGALILVDEKSALMKKLGKKQLILSLAVPLAVVPPELAPWRVELKSAGAELEYTFDAGDSASLYELLGRVSDLGIVFTDMNTRQRSLEDIFVSLVSERT